MRAVLVRTPGGPEELVIQDVAEPTPNNHQILIEIHATSLNRADMLQRRGLYPPPPGESAILGLECAGIVSKVGNEVQEFAVGDRVMALLGGGGYAERVAVHERLAIPIPEGVSFEAAAAIPEVYLTAHQALFGAGALNPGERVLIHAAAGGVGSAAVQIARELGAFVFATTRGEAKRAFLSELGAERVIDATQQDFAEVIANETRASGVDVIVDFIGASYAERNHAVLAVGGRWVVVGLLGGARTTVDFGRLLSRRQTIAGIVLRSRTLPEKAALVRAFRRDLLPWIREGKLRPVIDSVVPMSAVREAHARMEANLNTGKIILKVKE